MKTVRRIGVEFFISLWVILGLVVMELNTFYKMKLELLGVPKQNIEMDERCTSCAQDPSGSFLYHSNVREGEDAGRNLVVAWMD